MKRGGVLAAIAVTILVWGFAFIPLKLLTNSAYTAHPLSPEAFLVLRFVPLLPLLLLLLTRYARRERKELVLQDWPWMVAMGFLVVPGYHLPLNLALRTPLHTGLTSLIVNLSPALTYLLAVAFGQERMRRARSWGMAAAFAGLAVICGEEIARDGPEGEVFSWEGAGWVLLSAISWTLYTLIGRRIAHRHDPQFLFAASGAIGTLAVLAAAPLLVTREALGVYLALGPQDWAAWAYVSFLSSFFAYWAWILALTHYEASRLSSSANLVPLLVHAAAAVFLPREREVFTPFYFLGAAATVVGTFLVVRERREG